MVLGRGGKREGGRLGGPRRVRCLTRSNFVLDWPGTRRRCGDGIEVEKGEGVGGDCVTVDHFCIVQQLLCFPASRRLLCLHPLPISCLPWYTVYLPCCLVCQCL